MKKNIYDLTPEEVERITRIDNKAYDIKRNRDWRQGYSHSGVSKWETWDKIEHKVQSRKRRYATAAIVADALIAEGDIYDDALIINEDWNNIDHKYIHHKARCRKEVTHEDTPCVLPDCKPATQNLVELVDNEFFVRFRESITELEKADSLVSDEDAVKPLDVVYLSPRTRKPESDGLCVNWEVSLALAGMAASVLICMLLLACK